MSLISMEKFRFWAITFGIVWQMVWVTSAAQIDEKQMMFSNSKNSDQQKINCNTLCMQCDCMGFYCGEECICECNNEDRMKKLDKFDETDEKQEKPNKPDTECLAVMQNNARALNLPFELLIQGSNNNRIVRTALNLQQGSLYSNINNTYNHTMRPKRATVVIYKPEILEIITTTEKSVNRQRRGVANDNLDWLTGFTNGLIRPAPISGSRLKASSQAPKSKSQEHNSKPQATMNTNTKKLNKPEEKVEGFWFEDNEEQNNKKEIVRGRKSFNKPAVSYKKQRSNKSGSKKADSKNRKQDNENYLKKNIQRAHDEFVQKFDFENYPEKSLRDTSTKNLAELLYKTPMKMVEKLPIAVSNAIRRIRMNTELSNANKKRETELHELEEDDYRSAVAFDSAQESDEQHDDEYVDDSNDVKIDEIIRNIRKHLLNVVGTPTMKPTHKGQGVFVNRITKSPYYKQRSSNFMQRIKDAMEN